MVTMVVNQAFVDTIQWSLECTVGLEVNTSK